MLVTVSRWGNRNRSYGGASTTARTRPELATQPDPDRGTRTGSPGGLEKARQAVAALARYADHGRRGPAPERASQPRRTNEDTTTPGRLNVLAATGQ